MKINLNLDEKKNIPLVSICILTFNHAAYIKETLESILNQKTNFTFEVLIHDDASTDNTQKIIKEYQKKYPDIIKPILQDENQWSQGINPSVHFNYPRANAEFVAWCEGDDMWTDDYKLAKQVNLMQENPDIEISFHKALLMYCNNKFKKPVTIGDYGDKQRIIDFKTTIFRPYGMIPTASCIVRQRVKKELQEFMYSRPYMRSGDVFMQFLGSRRAGAVYIPEVMSIYRFETKSSLSKGFHDIRNNVNHNTAAIRAYIELNQNTNREYEKQIKKLILQRISWIFGRQSIPIKLIKELNISKLAKIYISNIKYIKKRLDSICKENNIIKIYGCASGCNLFMKYINKNKVNLIIDRDKRSNKKTAYDKPLVSLENSLINPQDIILASTLYTSTIEKEKIISLGASHEKVILIFDELAEMINIDYLEQDQKKDIASNKNSNERVPGWWV